MTRFVIIDYGVGNFRNVQKAFQVIGAAVEITDSIPTINAADALILPGVGAFGDAIDNIRARGLEQPLLNAAQAGKPFFGICVGMQLLFERSTEMGEHIGLGILPGSVERFPRGLTVPHMGWNQIEPQHDHPLLAEVTQGDFAYFAHSYHVAPTRAEDVLALTDYGSHFPSMAARDNICAIQFHPEKSQRVGLQILKNFVTFAERES